MASDGPRKPPSLATWADVDPARYPFDAVELWTVARTMVPAPPPRPVWHQGRSIGGPEARAWVEAVGMALSDRYGPWAYAWHWEPGGYEQLGSITDRLPLQAEAPAFVADSLLNWRRWLDGLAGRFDRFLPLLDQRQTAPGDLVTAWEAAIAHLLMTGVAPIVDDDGWQGWCRRILQWFLTAAGVPVERAEALADRAIDRRFANWARLSTTDIGDVAERLARDVLSSTGITPVDPNDNWPDTWPRGWPSWRATNTTGQDGQ